MASSATATGLPFLLFLFFFVTAVSNASDPCGSDGSDFSIFPIYSKCSPCAPPSPAPVLDTVLSMAKKDPARLAYLLSSKATVRIAQGRDLIQTASYVVRVKLGTPGQQMFMVMDTGSDAAFVPCTGCTGCAPGTALFSPPRSSTFLGLACEDPLCAQVHGQPCKTVDGPCLFNQSYGGDSSFLANLVLDSLTLGRDVVPRYAFGCIDAISGGSVPAQGLLGLGRGSMSLVSQTASLYDSTFSYCLPAFNSDRFSGSLILGPAGQRKGVRTTTPLLRNPRRPSLYYVNLTAVSVNNKDVVVPRGSFAFDPATGAGTIIDSGTVITRFVAPVYAAVRDAYRSGLKGSVSSLGAFDTCFDSVLNPAPPTVTLRFEGMVLALPVNNTIIHSSATSLACLAMASSPNNVNSVVNVIANLQQQNLRILFDVPNARVGIATEFCS